MVALGGVAAGLSLQVETGQGGSIGPRLFPLATSVLIAALGLAEILEGRARAGPKRPSGDTLPGIVMLAAVSVMYIAAIGQVGYLLATGLAAPAAFWIFGVRRPLGLLASALLCPVLFHLVFFEVLGIFPPYGAVFDLIDVIRAG